MRVRGELRGGFFGREMVHPTFKAVEAGTPLPSALTPVYPTGAQLPQAYLRKAVASALQRAPLAEVLPPDVRAAPACRRCARRCSFLHHPPADATLAALDDHSHPAWQRLKAEELLAQQLSQAQAGASARAARAAAAGACRGGLHEQLLAALAVSADRARSSAWATRSPPTWRATRPMHRLLQGDVGSGKTVVAALAAAIAIDAGWQCALMAPTEILAEQHFRKLVSWLLRR